MATENKAPAPKPAGKRPDVSTLGGLALALAGIVGGLILEGGEVKDISQITAALIVLGGTFGAVMVNFPLAVVIGGFKQLMNVFFEKGSAPDTMINTIVGFATKARKNGIVSLEQEADAVEDPFLRKALNLAVDGTDLQELRKMLELDIAVNEHQAEQEAKVWESAGGYAPTVGILGAVLGLIQVMKNLADIEAVGHGIAVAFVATVYGVGSANIFFLPAGNKIKARAHHATQMKELIVEGIVGIVEGLNPKLIRSKLEAYSKPAAQPKPQPAKEPKPSAAPAAPAAESTR